MTTPDLEKILSLYFVTQDGQREYKSWALKHNDLPRVPRAECFIINHFMRAWGHRFIYDEATLTNSLLQAGFVNVRRFEPGDSDDPNLSGIERHGLWIGERANRFETMVLQAEKPCGVALTKD